MTTAEKLTTIAENQQKVYDAGYADGQAAVEIVLQSKTVTPSETAQDVTADDGYTALEKVTVEAIPPEYIVPSGELEITENGVCDVAGYATVNVNVETGGGGEDNYTKITAKPSASTNLTFSNPLGGNAKAVSISRINSGGATNVRIYKCVILCESKLGAVEAVSSAGSVVRYGIEGVDGIPNNAQFAVMNNTIRVMRYSASILWDVNSEYEIEIWQ